MRTRPVPGMALMLILLAACGPRPVPAPAATPTRTPIPHAPEIRFALIGIVTEVNVWALFDEQGQSYNNYAVLSDTWPRLYHLSIPDRRFEALAASGLPSAVEPSGDLFAATVALREDLRWSDGQPFTAQDVAFTINTALRFRPGFDWRDYYDPAWLDHVEASDAHTVRFYFKRQPGVGIWQYGALQGPIVQRAFWESKISESAARLPPPGLEADIEALKLKMADQQKRIAALNAAVPGSGEEYPASSAELRRLQGDLDQSINSLAKTRKEFDSAMGAARRSLYALDSAQEPRLGTWLPGRLEGGLIQKTANPDFPFGTPHFDAVTYRLFPDQAAALTAIQEGQVDAVLAENGVESFATDSLVRNPTHRLRFLAINPLIPVLNDPALRQALACVLGQDDLTRGLDGRAAPLASFVLPEEAFWFNAQAALPCLGLDQASRLAQAVQALKSAGYAWDREPSADAAGSGLKRPDGSSMPSLTILASASDDVRASIANQIERRARLLGMQVSTRLASPEEVTFAVFSSHRFEFALLGWRVGEYPGYLCAWFGGGNQFHFDDTNLKSECEALNATSDLELARLKVRQIQSLLAQSVPFIPLYSAATGDLYRNISYPFIRVPDGLSGVFGAPGLAIPAP